VCPEYQAYVAGIAQAVADEIEDEGFTAIIRRTPKQRGEAVRQLKEMVKNIEVLMKQYVELAQRDSAGVDGFTLRRKMMRSFTDEAMAMTIVRSEFGAEALADAMHLSLTDLEKALSKRKGSAKEAKEAVQRALSTVLKFTPSKHYLEESRSL
jgi:hypothetical protein